MDKYEIKAQLGEGQFGAVYKAVHKEVRAVGRAGGSTAAELGAELWRCPGSADGVATDAACLAAVRLYVRAYLRPDRWWPSRRSRSRMPTWCVQGLLLTSLAAGMPPGKGAGGGGSANVPQRSLLAHSRVP